MKKHLLHFFLKTIEDMYVPMYFFVLTLLFCCVSLSAQTTYKLVQVSSVTAGGMYVFEQNGYVMINSISSNALQTTDSYSTTELTGSETYVWSLVSASGGFKIKNVSDSKYLANNSDANMTMTSNTKASIWSFSFNGTATITNNYNNRFLAYTEVDSHVYKTYTNNSYPHAITVYKLVQEGAKSDATTKWYADNTKSEEVTYKCVNGLDRVCLFCLDTNSTGTVTYESSDEDVATFDGNGKIITVGYGTTTITATTAESKEYNSSSASFVLSVGDEYVDVLDVYNTGNTTTGYEDFTDIAGNSGAVYMGNTSCSNSALRVKNNYTNCIAVSTTAGIVKKVSVKWNSNTADGRVITVYGRNVAYSDLNTSNYVTKLGTITYGEEDSSLDLTSKATDYGYIGLSANDILLVDYIVVEWERPATIVMPEEGKGYKTFCYPKALDFSGVSGLTAYTATVEDGVALFTPVEGSVPKCTGLLLAGEVNTSYEVPCVATSSTNVSANVMVGVTENTNVAAGIYVLYKLDDNVCFYQTSTTFTVGANTAYIPSGVSGSKALNISIVDVATGLNGECIENKDDDIIYNVAGQIVGKDYKGMVVKGRKLYLQK